MRVSDVKRTAGWIATEYNNQSSPGTFYSIATEENAGTTGITLTGGTVTGSAAGVTHTADAGGNSSPTLTVNQPDGSGDTVTVGDSYDINYDLADSDDVVTVAFIMTPIIRDSTAPPSPAPARVPPKARV